jgi:hypothetical protein
MLTTFTLHPEITTPHKKTVSAEARFESSNLPSGCIHTKGRIECFQIQSLRWNRGEYCKSILKEEKASHCTLCTNINSWSRNEHQVGLNAASMHHDHVERMKQRMPSITNQTTPNPIACLTQNANRQNRWSFKPKDRDQLLETFCVVSA